jgi:hypothetical protein
MPNHRTAARPRGVMRSTSSGFVHAEVERSCRHGRCTRSRRRHGAGSRIASHVHGVRREHRRRAGRAAGEHPLRLGLQRGGPRCAGTVRGLDCHRGRARTRECTAASDASTGSRSAAARRDLAPWALRSAGPPGNAWRPGSALGHTAMARPVRPNAATQVAPNAGRQAATSHCGVWRERSPRWWTSRTLELVWRAQPRV